MPLIFDVLNKFLEIMFYLIIARALISWFDPRGSNPISRFLYQVTEPIIAPIRSVTPRLGMIDISPMIAVFLIIILQQMLARATA